MRQHRLKLITLLLFVAILIGLTCAGSGPRSTVAQSIGNSCAGGGQIEEMHIAAPNQSLGYLAGTIKRMHNHLKGAGRIRARFR